MTSHWVKICRVAPSERKGMIYSCKRAHGKQQGNPVDFLKDMGMYNWLVIQIYDRLLSLGLKIPVPSQIVVAIGSHHCTHAVQL